MMKFIFALFVFSFSLFAKGQKVCNQTTVYFDFGKYNLRQEEKLKLDSIFQIASNELLIELYGHTDSINDIDYNMELSLKRVNEVIDYLKTENKKAITFKKYYFGESNPITKNDTEENRVFNRRVEINFIPLDNGEVVFSGKNGEEAKIDTSYFGNCNICNLKPKFISYSTEEEANAAGINLITGGMMSFHFEGNGCIKEKENCCISVTLSIPSKRMDPSMTAWTLNENKRWQEEEINKIKFIKDTCKIKVERLCLFCNSVIRPLYFVNCDIPKPCYHYLKRLPYEIPKYIDSIQINKHFWYYKFKIGKNPYNQKVFVENDELIYLVENWKNISEPIKIVTYFKDKVYFLTLDSSEISQLPYNITGDLCKYRVAIIDSSLFEPLLYSDTIISLKIKGIKKAINVGFYNQEYDHLELIKKTKKHKYESNYLNFPHQISFSGNKNKTCHFNYDDFKSKYCKRTEKLKVKIKKKKIKQYEKKN